MGGSDKSVISHARVLIWALQYLIKCLKENLEFWSRFSTSVHQIQKFQTSIQDLHAELQKLKDKKQEGSGKNQSSKSDVKPIDRFCRRKELFSMKTEVTYGGKMYTVTSQIP
jgi:cell division protein FtsB